MIKRIYTLVLLVVLLGTQSISAQKKVRESINFGEGSKRHEIAIPQVNGYNVYKADLHVHTLYSDGGMLPSARVDEAWHDGLDIIAITDHYEIRKYEQRFLDFLYGYFGGKAPKAKNNRITVKNPADKDGIMVDMNQPVREAQERAKLYGMLVIPGTEISRESTQQGHFNVLFAKDYNKLYDIDIEKCFAKAREQGALIIHNHPGWRRKTMDKSPEQEQIYAEKLVDGIEVVNGLNLYPKMIDRCVDEKLTIFANTDCHRTSAQYYPRGGEIFRTMTFILAKDCTEKAIKDALLKRRTIGYSHNHLIGEEMWLKEFLNAAVECKFLAENEKKGHRAYQLTNHCSVPFILRRGKAIYTLNPFQSIRVNFGKDKETQVYRKPEFVVDNMWTVGDKHPKFTIEIDK